jgi:drug/metabolite transporter (DMT)-like permease
MVNQKILGILFGVGAGAMWAVEAVLGKILFASFSFIQVTASEVFFATLTAFAYVLATREHVRLDGKDLGNVLVVGVVGTVFAPLMYFFGLSHTLAVNATLIAHLQPLFVAIFGFYFLREKLHRHDLFGGLLIILAAILITSRTVYNLTAFRFGNFGDLMVFFAMVSWAIVAIPGKQLTRQASSVLIVGYRFLVASIVFVPVLLYMNQLIVSSIYQVLLGVLAGLGYIFYYEGLKRMKSSQVALAELSSPFFASILAWNILGETVMPMQMIGALLLISGLYILTGEKAKQ